MQGNVSIIQGNTRIRGDEALLWVERQGDFGNPTYTVIAFVDGSVIIDQQPAANAPNTTNGQAATPVNADAQITPLPKTTPWFGRLYSDHSPEVRAAKATGEPDPKPPVYARAVERRTPPEGIQRTQFAESRPESIAVPQFAAPVVGARRVQVFPRSGVSIQARYFQNPRNPNEQVAVVTNGVQIRIDGLGIPLPTGDLVGQTLDISADRVVIWTPSNIRDYLEGEGNEAENVPLELYLEGDIIFREGDRIVYAQAMYYNVPQRIGTILNAEVLTPVKNYAGLARCAPTCCGKSAWTASWRKAPVSPLAAWPCPATSSAPARS